MMIFEEVISLKLTDWEKCAAILRTVMCEVLGKCWIIYRGISALYKFLKQH